MRVGGIFQRSFSQYSFLGAASAHVYKMEIAYHFVFMFRLWYRHTSWQALVWDFQWCRIHAPVRHPILILHTCNIGWFFNILPDYYLFSLNLLPVLSFFIWWEIYFLSLFSYFCIFEEGYCITFEASALTAKQCPYSFLILHLFQKSLYGLPYGFII